mgnify:CR=1 FL=1
MSRNDLVILDGKRYNLSVTGLERSFEISDTDATGRTKDWKMHRDVVGTFYNYTIKLAVQRMDWNSYNRFYEAISAPVASHTLTVPYNAETLTFQAYCTKGKDKLIYKSKKNGQQLWDDLSVNFIAMEPQRKA